MATSTSAGSGSGAARSAPPATPGWVAELVDILEDRRRILITAAVGLSLLGTLAAFLLPQFVPPRPLVGAAVGLAAALLAVAIAVAADSADLTVRGARHVRAAGGQLAASLGADATPSAAADLAARIDARAAVGGRHWVAVAPASRGFGSVSPWADALGIALADAGRRVVVIDLADGPTPGQSGVCEIVDDELKLGQAVVFDPERMMARLGPGADHLRALEVLAGLVPRLPSDIEILVLALPALGQPGALTAAGMLDRVLVVAAVDETPRVDLIASLDAVDATDTAAEVVLVDRSVAPAPDAGAVPAAAVPEEPPAEDTPGWQEAPGLAYAEPARPSPFAPAPEAARAPEPEPARRPVELDPGPGFLDDDEPTLEYEPLRLDDDDRPIARDEPPEVVAAVAEDGPDDDHVAEEGRWAAPPAHRTLTGAQVDPPAPTTPEPDTATIVPDEPDDDVRVTAALQTLAQEVWSRDARD